MRMVLFLNGVTSILQDVVFDVLMPPGLNVNIKTCYRAIKRDKLIGLDKFSIVCYFSRLYLQYNDLPNYLEIYCNYKNNFLNFLIVN